MSDAQDGSVCVLKLGVGDQPFAVFGMPLLMDYYVVHDLEEGQIGFAPSQDSTKLQVTQGAQPSQTIIHSVGPAAVTEYVQSYIIVTVILILWIGLAWVVRRYYFSRSTRWIDWVLIALTVVMAWWLYTGVRRAFDQQYAALEEDERSVEASHFSFLFGHDDQSSNN